MNLLELIENNKRMTAGLAAQSASSAQAAPDIIGRAVEAQMLTGVAPSTVVQDPGGFQRLYQEQRNAGALLAGPITTEWMNEAPENAGLVLDEVPSIIDWELTSERLVREATGSGNLSAAARSWWLSMRSMRPSLQLAGQQPALEASIDYLGTLRALEDQLNEGVIPNYEMLATSDGRNARTSILQLQRYATMDPEQRAAERARVVQQIAGREESIGYLRDVLRDYSESQGLLAAGRTVDFTDIRDFRSLAEWASFTGTQAVIDAGSSLAIGAGGFLVGGPAGAGTAVFSYGTLRGFTGITAEQAIQDAPYTTEEIARAGLFGTLSGLTEVALGPSARFVRGAAGRALTREAYSEVSQEVLNRVSQGYLRRIGREVVASGVEEFFQEGAQYFLQKAGVEGADFRWTDETLLEAFNAAMAGMVGGGVVGGGMGARQQIVLERISRELRDAGRTVQNMEELANVTQDLQLATRSPTKFQQLAERLGLSRVPVFFQAEDLNTYFQSQNKDPVTEVVKLGGTAEDFEAALASGGRISVTAEGLARAGLRGADGDFLRDNGSFTPAGSTPAEAQSINQTYNEIRQQIQEQSRMAEMAPERRQVYDAIYGQLRRAGRSQREAEANAALSTAFFETMAARYGEDSGLDLYRRFGFRVEGPRQMARAEAAAEAAQLQIPDETVAIINDAITQAQAGGPVTLPITPEVTLALQTLGVPVDPSGTISAEDAQRLTAALQALEDVVPRATLGRMFEQGPVSIPDQERSVFEQAAAPRTAEERLTEGREPPREPRGNTYMGVGEQYTVANPSPDAPAVVRNGGMILNSTNEGNADAQSAALDALLEAHPDPLASEEAWVAFANDAFSLTRVPMPPWRTIDIVNEGPGAIGAELDKLSAGMIRDAEAGLKTAQEFGEVYASGQATPDVTAKAFLWSFLSRRVSPYVQEGAFLDAITSPVLTDIMQRASVEGWSQSLSAEYTAWAESAIPPGSPGRGTQNNLNDFGRNFMTVMTRRHPDAGDRTGLQIIHDMIADGAPSAAIRREFLKRGSGAGIDNKVVSFTLLLLGRTDVLVLDRVQVRNQFNDGRFDGQNIYDAEVVNKKQVTGSAFAAMTFGHKGLLYYEAMERALQPIIEAAYAERGMEGSLGRYHWDSWLAASNQEVGHASVEGLLRDAQGVMQPYAGAFVRQGKYTNYDYGFRYGILPDGSAATVVETLDGSGAIVLPNEVLANDKHPTRKTLSSLASKAKKRGSEYGVTQPWTAALTAEEQAKYDEAIRSAGSPAPDFWADPADAVRPTDATGQEFFQSATRDVGDEGTRRTSGGDVVLNGRATTASAIFGGTTERPVYEITDTALFGELINEAKAALGPIGAQVTAYDDYTGKRLFVFDDGASGFALDGDDIISVFSIPSRAPQGAGQRVLELAVAEGGRRLDAFDTYLPKVYERGGFRAVAALPFDTEAAPPGWDYDFFAEIFPETGGQPDVVFMVYDPANANRATDNEAADYDAGLAAQTEALAEVAPLELEQRPEGAEPRGSITFPGGGLDSGQAVIRLFERADRSTFAHEAGHFFLEAFKQLATDPQAPAGMIDDFRTINEYLGRDPEDTSEYTVDQQETWARSFEAYIMEGKAPSIALRSAFERFKAWLTRIYRQVVSLQVELSPEIRDVMDRMLATEEEIALVKAEQEISPLFLERPTGMDEADYDRYRKTATEADDEASQRLMNKLMARIRLQRTKTYNAERKALTTTVEEELRQTRTYQTIERLQTGETRLNRQQIVDQFGEDALRDMNREKLGGKRAVYGPGGADLSVMAELMGYDSETQLIDELRGAQKFSIAVELEVNKRLDQKYGDLLTDGSIKDAARAAMHSDKRGQLLTAEANQLRAEIEAAGGPTPPNLSREAIKQSARDMIQDMSVRQAASPNAFLRAERKAAGEAQRAFSRVARAPSGRLATTGAQDLIAAHAAKRRQLLNHYLYVEARKAEELVAKMRKQSTRLQKKSTREAVASPYIDEIYALLEQYDFRQLSPGQVARQQNLAAFVAAMQAADREGELSIDDRLIQRSQRTHFSTLTVDELQGLKDTLDNLEHLGRTKMKLLDAKRGRSYAEVQQSMLRSIEQNLPDQAPGLVERQGDARKRAGRIALNTVLSADAIINRLDGSVQGVGDVWRALKEPLNEGLARVQVRKQQAAEDFVGLFKKHYTDKERRDLNSKMLSVPEIGQSLPKQAILAIALNTGNRDNFERLTNSDNAHSIPRDQVQAVLDRHMDERDWRFVQDVWYYINSYWPEIAAQERALTGVNPRKVDSAPQITPYAFVKGGYFPIRYDPRLSGAVQDYDHNQMMENLKGGRFAKAQTRNGHTKERVSSTGQPLRLDLGIAIAHVNDVIYDLELRQPIQNSWRLLNDPQVDATFKRKGAAEDAEALKLWVQDVANGDRWSGNGLSAAYRHLRGGLSIAKMGFSITTLVQQPTGLLQSAVVVGKGPLGKALWKYKNNPLRNAAAVRAVSPFMEERQQTFQRDLTVLTESMAEDPTFSRYRTFRRVMSAAAFYLIQKTQFYIVDVPTWMAAYDTELRRNGGDTDAAASVADQLVARSQGSGLLSDRTAFERGTLGKDTRNVELARLMTTFGSYMMAKFSVATQRVRGTDLKSPAEFVSLLVDLLMLYTIETAIALFLTGHWPDFEDEEEDPLLLFLAKETGLAIMSGLPLAREAASTLDGFGGGGTLAAAIEDSSDLFTGAYRMGEIALGLEDEDRARAALKDVLGGMGVLFQLPTIQLERTLNGMFDDDMQFRDDFTAIDLLLGRRAE